MCRNIRVLYNFEPPTTQEEIRAAAIQFVRKVSGLTRPSAVDAAPCEEAVQEIAASTERLLARLKAQTAVRTREAEREKARERWTQRAARVAQSAGGGSPRAVQAVEATPGHSHEHAHEHEHGAHQHEHGAHQHEPGAPRRRK